MDFDAMVNKLPLKKMLVAAFVGLIVFWIVRMIMIFAFLNTFTQIFSNFNTNFDKAQNEIHEKIESSAEDLHRRQREFEKRDEEFSQFVAKQQKDVDDYFARVHKEAEVRDRKLNKVIKESPDQISEQHIVKSEKYKDSKEEAKAEKSFFVEQGDTGFSKANGVSCQFLLGSRPTKFNVTSSRSVAEQEEQYKYLMKWRQEKAKQTHCEKFV